MMEKADVSLAAENAIRTIRLADYRRRFFSIFIPLATIIAGGFLLVQVSSISLAFFTIKKLSTPVMAILVVMAFIHSYYQKKRLAALEKIPEFTDRAAAYQKFYSNRLIWFLISGITCTLLYILSGHRLFLYFALFDCLLLLNNFPNKQIFKKELKEDQIIFY